MALRFPEHTLEEILNRVDIAELIASYIPLKKAGRNFKACCPFHYEKTPSFMVSPEKAIYHCFGCNCGGNAFSFLMRYEHLDFREAVETLARKTGVVLPVLKRDEAKVSLNQEIYRANELAAEFYHRSLLKDKQAQIARDYLARRKLKPETAKTFKIGFALDSWDMILNYLRANKINLNVIEAAGLVVAKEKGGYYDRFRKRITFPIFDAKGRIIGFGARSIDEAETGAKYINTPETAVFIKGNNLYGLNFAKQAIREKDAAIVVEGYMDTILPFQCGLKNILATSGTALTTNQIILLKRYTKNITVIFDADKAGELASLRSLDLFIEEDIYVKVCALEPGFDPDSFVKERGIESFSSIIKESLGLFDYKMKLLLERFDSKTIEGRAGIAQEMIPTINKFKNQIFKTEFMKKLSQMLKLEERALLAEAEKNITGKGFKRLEARVNSLGDSRLPAVEKMILKLMLKDVNLISKVKKEIELVDFQDERLRQIATCIFQLQAKGKDIVPHQLMNLFSDGFINQIISELTFNEGNYSIDDIASDDRDKMLNECLKRIKLKRSNIEKRNLHEQILDAQGKNDEQKVNLLIRKYNELIKK